MFLVGLSLVPVGVQQWGGGDDCYANPGAACTQVGDSSLPYGSIEYIGMFTLILCSCGLH